MKFTGSITPTPSTNPHTRIRVMPKIRKVAIGLALCMGFAATLHAGYWVTNSPMANGRTGHTATLLSNGKVLVAGGYNGTNWLSSAEIYDPVTGKWTTTASMTVAREFHTATLLTNGQVLVTGGFAGVNHYSSAELYDPVAGTWTATAAMSSGRELHTATLLQSGRVLVAGGRNPSDQAQGDSQIYDPVSGTWSAPISMTTARYWHTATLLPNGKVLAAGGQGVGGTGTILANAEVFDPVAGTWSATGSLIAGRYTHTATLLANGKVLAAGGAGIGATYVSSAELYDPGSGTWSSAGSMSFTRAAFTSTLLPNGQVLVVGGSNPNPLNTTEVYDPNANAWSPAATIPNGGREYHTATMLPSGLIVVAGGDGVAYLASTASYDPGVGTWASAGPTTTFNLSYTPSTLLPNGNVLIAGGVNSIFGALKNAELFVPSSNAWIATNSMITPRGDQTATLLTTGKVLLAGGYTQFLSTPTNNAELFDPASGTWALTGSMTVKRVFHTATLLQNGKVLVAGGYSNTVVTASAELYDPVTGTWSTTGSMNVARLGHTANLLPNGKVLVSAGGGTGGTDLYSAELYDPTTQTWSSTGSLNVNRAGHSATLLPNGLVLIAGGINNPTNASGLLTSAELYDPATGIWTITGSMNGAREGHTATLLLSGKVLVAGGTGPSNNFQTISSAEIYDPAAGTWISTGSMSTNRSFGTAAMLGNGKVVVAGGDGAFMSTSDLFDSGLGFSAAWQPQVTTYTSPLPPGGIMTVTGSLFRGVSEGAGGQTATSASDHPVVQLRNTQSGQVQYLMVTNWTTNSLACAPASNMPPGYTLVTVFVNGVPSTFTSLGQTAAIPGPIILTNPKLAGGVFTCNFTNVPGAVFSGLAATNPALAGSSWTVLSGSISENPPGHYQLTDPQAGTYPKRYYRASSP